MGDQSPASISDGVHATPEAATKVSAAIAAAHRRLWLATWVPRTAMLLALVGVFAGGSAFLIEARRTRLATEVTRDRVGEVRDLLAAMRQASAQQQPQHAICRKADSHLDHDVDLGPIGPCPNPDDGACVTWQGTPIAMSAAASRCQAGKFQ